MRERHFLFATTLVVALVYPPAALAANPTCAKRLSIALQNKTPISDLLNASDPPDMADAMVKSPEFIEKFSNFANMKMNDQTGTKANEDVAYYMVKNVLQNGLPWKEVFLGRTNLGGTDVAPVVQAGAGPGIFGTDPWKQRYAGNEDEGIRLVSTFRVIQNLTGKELEAANLPPGADASSNGRQAEPCVNCHFKNWYALDKNAQVLPRRNKQMTNNRITFQADINSAQGIEVLDGKMVKNFPEYLSALADSENFNYNACKLAWQFLKGREENSCETDLMTKCLTAFKASGKIQDAVLSFINDEDFCK